MSTTLALAMVPALAVGAQAPPGRLTVRVDRPGHGISPSLYGLMTEEINHSYDGGLYAELIRNRAFRDDPHVPAYWALVQDGGGTGAMALDDSRPLSAALPTSLKLTVTQASTGQRVGVANDGYWGVPVRPRTRYRASFYARSDGAFSGPLTVDIEGSDGKAVCARARVPRITTGWRRYTVDLTTGNVGPSENNRFVVAAQHPGTVWLDLVSLFPPTYYDRPNGNRPDLMQKMAAMQPAFLRLPGGNYLEGNTITERFDWKKTIGPLTARPGHQGPWGYRSTDGMGLLEFLEWCEDLHMAPVLAVFGGYALGGEHVSAGPGLAPFVQDALDEIEYVTGDAHTRWGAVRARDGHPAPFPLAYVEVGNEDFFDRSGSYDGRFAQFYDAIKARFPRLKIIATTRVRSRTPDVYDEHFYRSARAMEADAGHYDRYSRTGPKVFVGEWATTEGRPTPTLNAALGDAAWMTGMERNSDVVTISAYAPLLVNVNPGASQWPTNLIGYDALRSFGSPSYYAQVMFSANRGDVVLPVEVAPQTAAPQAPPRPQGAVGVGTWATQAEFRNVRVTHGDTALYQSDFTAGDAGWRLGRGQWQVQDGVLRQTGAGTDLRATVGDRGWTDYTYSLQARKISGSEGFLVLFHVQGRDNLVWWNIGGWGNTRSGLERIEGGEHNPLGVPAPVTVETGRWYDIRVEVRGTDIRCYLDNTLVTEATDTPGPEPGPLFATASRVRASGDVILKVVNVSDGPQTLQVDLRGAHGVGTVATGQVLTGDPQDQNTLAQPTKVVPRVFRLTGVGPMFVHVFPAHSVTVLRVKTAR